MKRKIFAVAVLVALCLCLPGCTGRSFVTERQLEDLTKQFLETYYAQRYEDAAVLTTGRALDELILSLPAVKAMNTQNKITIQELKCDFVSGDRSRGAVVAEFTLEQSVPGYGTDVADVTAVLKWVKVLGEWRAYAFNIAGRVMK